MVAATKISRGFRVRRTEEARGAASRREALVDASLVSRFKAGDETAFVEIVSRHRKRLFHIALDMLHNRADAEEIAQDTLIRAHRNLAGFRGDSSLSTWLCCITLNLSRNRFRYHRRRQRHAMLPLDAAIGDDNPATLADLVACAAPSPVREAVNREFAVAVNVCTGRLTPCQREVLTLRVVQHQSYDTIGRILGIDTGTVKSRIARARSCLRELVATVYPEFAPSAGPAGPFESLRPSGWMEVMQL